jgi:hypothetical protein
LMIREMKDSNDEFIYQYEWRKVSSLCVFIYIKWYRENKRWHTWLVNMDKFYISPNDRSEFFHFFCRMRETCRCNIKRKAILPYQSFNHSHD